MRPLESHSASPTPLKVFGRGHYACTRCKSSKIKCSGEKPACANCKSVDKGHLCHYPSRDRKIVIMESDLHKLQAQLRHTEDLLKLQGPGGTPKLGSPAEMEVQRARGPELQNSMGEVIQNRSGEKAQNLSELDPQNLSELDPQNPTGIHMSNSFGQPWPPTQNRDMDSDLRADSYLVADAENDFVPYKLLLLCAHHLPAQFYSARLIARVRQTYSSEFYLVEGDEIDSLVAEIYRFFASAAFRDQTHRTALPAMSPVPLCHFFALLAFAEQLLNSQADTLSLSALVSNTPRKIPGKDFFSIATKLFHLSYEQPDLRFIQSSVILGLFACNLNRYNTVYNFFGVALRSAVANGYHRRMEPPPNLDQHQLQRHRVYEEKTKRLWWTIFVVDIIWAARMNMPVHIDYTDTDVALPTEGPVVSLGDTYDAESLECNVHLVKYMAKFNQLIYGPNVRTMSVNYITTDSMNQKLLVKKILSCIDDIVVQFEDVTLLPQKQRNMLSSPDRNLANLFLRYNQLVILVVEPLFSLLFDERTHIDNIGPVLRAISRAVAAATRTVSIFLKLYEYNKLFVLGFWDSRHLFSALMIMILASVMGYEFRDCSNAVALLKYMAENDNINAKNSLHKVGLVHGYLNEMTELSINLDWSCKIADTVVQKDESFRADEHGVFFNPFVEYESNTPRLTKRFSEGTEGGSMYEQLGIASFSLRTRELLLVMAKTIQSWDNYSGLPIHLSGTARYPYTYHSAEAG